MVGQLNQQVNTLRQLSSAVAGSDGASLPTSPLPQQQRQQQQQQSPRVLGHPPLSSLSGSNCSSWGGGGGGALGSPTATGQQSFRSPLAGSAIPPSPSIVSSSSTSRYGATFATPQAGKLHNTNTPTTASATTPSALGGRHLHPRYPPQATPSPGGGAGASTGPGLYSNYKSLRYTGGAGIGSGSSAASTAGATSQTPAHSVSNSANIGGTPMSARHPFQTQQNQAAAAPAPVQLSEEDQQACTQLLLSQTELLEKAQGDLGDLENRLKSLRARYHI